MIILLIILCIFSQIAEKQRELEQLREQLHSVRTEIEQLEKKKIGALAHIEKVDEGIGLTIKYIDELTSQESYETAKIKELNKEIARLESKMKLRKDDLRERLIRLYKWTPFYKMEILFSSKSLPEILSTSYYLQILAEDDHRAFFEFQADWERYLTDKKLREDLIASLEERRKEKETELSRLNDERKKKKEILNKASHEENEKRQLEKELKSAQRKLEELIVALEKQREKDHTSEIQYDYKKQRHRY
jgi:peptidoglycan hydrolase CwlO-like protein